MEHLNNSFPLSHFLSRVMIYSRRALAMAACAQMAALHLTFPMMVALAETQAKTTDVAEIFCGVSSICKAGEALGYCCEGFDKEMDQDMNVFHATGLEKVVKMVGRIKPGGLLWISPDCSSFCGLCIAQTERSLDRPEGNQSRTCVRNGNYMAQVSAMLFVLGWLLGANPVLENPLGNWIWKLPCITKIFSCITVTRASLCRCRFSTGYRPKKAYGLAGTATWVELLNFPCNHSQPHQKLANVKSKNGKVQINGKPKALKESASYPLPMGRKVIEIWRKNGEEAPKPASMQPSWKLCMEENSMMCEQETQPASSSSWKTCAEEKSQPASISWKYCLE